MPTLNEQRNLFVPDYQIHHLGDLFKKYFLPTAGFRPFVDAKRFALQEVTLRVVRRRPSPTSRKTTVLSTYLDIREDPGGTTGLKHPG